jgi:ribosomal protein S18 acetylase RimI-like enzyme
MIHIEQLAQVTPEVKAAIVAPLNSFSRLQGFVWQPQSLVLALREALEIVGGLIGHWHWEWLHIEVLAVSKHLRRQGWGRKLMAEAERLAMTAGCHSAWVDTFSFQARPFYERLGYHVFGELADYPTGQTRFFLVKKLVATQPQQ